MTAKLRVTVVLAAIVLPLDQLTKWWVEGNVTPGIGWTPLAALEGFFRITHARNPGAALGILQDWPPIVFIGVALIALGVIFTFYRGIRADDVRSATALGMILGGALGNLTDRVVRGHVVDFLQFDLGLFIFPDFNVADAAIVVGVALLLLDVFTQEAEESAAAPEGELEPKGEV